MVPIDWPAAAAGREITIIKTITKDDDDDICGLFSVLHITIVNG